MSKEFDAFVIGLCVGGLFFLWVGYWLRKRVERWRRRQSADSHHLQALEPPRNMTAQRGAYKKAKHIPFDDLNAPARVGKLQADQRQMIRKADLVPLEPALRNLTFTSSHEAARPIPTALPGPGEGSGDAIPRPIPSYEAEVPLLPWPESQAEGIANAKAIRDQAIAVIAGSGFKRADAIRALDACTLVERASGLDTWVTCAFRHLHNTKP